MDMSDASIPLSIVAATLAVLSFLGAVWRLWRDRPRLFIYLGKVTIVNKPDNARFEMLEVRVSNVGFRPTILTDCVFIGDKSAYHPGIDDEPAATYGVRDQRFPALIEPGNTVTFHPISIAAIERNATESQGLKHYHAYKYMCLEDSFGKFHPVEMELIRWRLHLSKSWRKPIWWRRVCGNMKAELYLRRARLSDRI